MFKVSAASQTVQKSLKAGSGAEVPPTSLVCFVQEAVVTSGKPF